MKGHMPPFTHSIESTPHAPRPSARARVAAISAALAALGALAASGPAVAAPTAGFARAGAGLSSLERTPLMHGVAGDRKLIFVTEPAVERPGARPRVVALNRLTGRKVGELPQPSGGGFGFPFSLRVPHTGRIAVLDNAGWPPAGPPTVDEYSYGFRGGKLRAKLERKVDFTGLPLYFAEDFEALPGHRYVVSESIVGGLWIVGRNGRVRPGLLPSSPTAPLAALGPCAFPTGVRVGKVPFVPPGLMAPGIGSLAYRDGQLFFSTSCRGGLHRLALKTLLDTSRPAEQRARQIRTISPRPEGTAVEVLKGLSFNRWSRSDRNLYAGDPFHLRLLRIDPKTGRRTVVSDDPRLFNFTVAATFLPPLPGQRNNPLVAISDQEYRWSGLNTALTKDAFAPPFLLTKLTPAQVERGR